MVFILNPVLSEVQVKETVSKFEDFLLVEEQKWFKEDWALKMAYEIQNKKSGFTIFEFKVAEKF
jgi:small subunit ribosomal protein S6